MVTTSPMLDGLSVREIDRELAALTDDLDNHVSDTDVAVALERRRQALLSGRKIAVVRERAKLRQQQVEAVHEARAGFAALEVDLTADLPTQAAAIERTVGILRDQVKQYRDTARRLADVEDFLVPPAPRHEFHLHGKLDRLVQIEEPLAECFVRAGLVVSQGASARNPEATLQGDVASGVHKFFAAARQRLPPPVADENERADEDSPEGVV